VTAYLLLLGFAALCLLAATVPQVAARRRHALGAIGRWPGATPGWGDELAEWLRTGIGSAVAR
jgi:hypothetical protein